MDSIVKKLSSIENAASAIVAHAEAQKKVLDQEYLEKQKAFDRNLEIKTQKKIQKIKDDLENRTQRLLKQQAGEYGDPAVALEQEYEEHHAQYALAILKRITEV